MSISKEGNRSVRTVTPTLTATTMAMNTTLSRVDMPPRLNRLEVKGFFHFRLAGLPLLFYLLCLILFRFHCFLPPLAPAAALHLAGGEKDEHGGHA